MKAIILLSGGLDSRLAARLLQEQGIELEAVNFSNIFSASKDGEPSEAVRAAGEYNIPLKVFDITKELMDIVENPRYGHGSGVNPCIDCRILALKRAKEYMPKAGAGFIATGEVLGERPMSQRKDAINIIEKETGLKGLILRPLCAKLFEPTMPEINGHVDRERLMSIKGRSRKPQMALARELGVSNYPSPAGGCLLTDKEFAKKVKDLIEHKEWDFENAVLLRYGRHFRIKKDCRVIIGRNREENAKIEELKSGGDCLLQVKSHPGPTAIVRGRMSDGDINIAAGLTASFVTKKKEGQKIKIEAEKRNTKDILEVLPFNKDEVFKYKIGNR